MSVVRLRRIAPIAAAAGMLCAFAARAHAPQQAEALAWTFDPWIVLPLSLSLALYAIGHWRLSRRAPGSAASRRRAWAFGSGWLLLAAALVTPLHAAGERSFAAHMLEHEVLMLAAAPLLVLSRPLGVWLWAFPRPARRWLARCGQRRTLGAVWRAATAPLLATVVQAAVLWLWHAPPAFDLALAQRGWHVVQHVCFLLSALLFWWAMLQGRAQRIGVAVGCLFFTSLVSGALGALMAFSRGPWYAGYSALGLDAFGLSPAEDQQLAGLLMWVPGGLVHAAAGIALLARGLAGGDAAQAPT